MDSEGSIFSSRTATSAGISSFAAADASAAPRGMRSVQAARTWFERRRASAGASELVFAVYDRMANNLPSLASELRELGFDMQTARVNVNTDAGGQQMSVACFRDAREDDEISVYLFGEYDNDAVDRQTRALKAARFLTPIYAAADVLVLCLDRDAQINDANDLSDLAAAEALLMFDHSPIKQLMIVNQREAMPSPAVVERIEVLKHRFANRVVLAIPTGSSITQENRAWTTIFEICEKVYFQVSRPQLSDDKETSLNPSNDTTSEGNTSSTDQEIERAMYEAMLVSGARRVVLLEGMQPLLASDDVVDANRDWSTFDERIALQLSALAADELCALLLRQEDFYYAIDASNATRGLLVASMWDMTHDAAAIPARSRALTDTIDAVFRRLRDQGA
ncbi:MAG: hypothetical protein ACRCWJ_00220 [Casimicrobium sp.]